jgi:exodeoxyribonuclease V alpha subunit
MWRRIRASPVILAAPPAKAASRMKTAPEDKVYTLHSHLGINCAAKIDEGDTGALLIIDEASMIDLHMMDLVVQAARKYGLRLVIVGDDSQLPSVSYGKVLEDLIEWAKLNGKVVQLTHIHRQEGGSPVVDLAVAIRQKQKIIDAQINNDKVSLYESSSQEEAKRLVMDIRAKHLSETPFGFVVLSPFNAYVDDINKKVLMTTRGNDYLGQFRKGDVVVCTKNLGHFSEEACFRNDYDEYVRAGINGDVGIYKEKGLITMDTGETARVGDDGNIRHAHAMTVHKAQGSEWETVVVMLGNNDQNPMVNRNLLYTAITRTRNRLYLIGSRQILQKFVNTNLPVRYTGGFL